MATRKSITKRTSKKPALKATRHASASLIRNAMIETPKLGRPVNYAEIYEPKWVALFDAFATPGRDDGLKNFATAMGLDADKQHNTVRRWARGEYVPRQTTAKLIQTLAALKGVPSPV